MAGSINDVARLAGVSTATVSRVLSQKPYVRPEIRKRVLDAVKELDYQPNRIARSLRVKHSRILGLVISDIQNPFFTSLVRAVEDMAYSNQHAIFLCNTDEDPEKEALYIDLMIAEKVAGVIITPTREKKTAVSKLVKAGIPVVSVDRRIKDLSVDTVVIDNVSAACNLICHLIEDGQERIGAILGSLSLTTGHERLEGYLEALKAHGIPSNPQWIRTGLPKISNGYQFAKELLEMSYRPTALFTGNNLLTIGALRAIRDCGLTIPQDIALVAFDDIDWTTLIEPKLTLVIQPTYELGRTAADLILKRMSEPSRPTLEVILKSTISIRGSCALEHSNTKDILKMDG